MTSPQRTMVGGRVLMDGQTFVDINFEDADLVYEGGAVPSFNNCTFDRTRFMFAGPAENTIVFLRSMAGPTTNMRHIVTGLITELAE